MGFSSLRRYIEKVQRYRTNLKMGTPNSPTYSSMSAKNELLESLALDSVEPLYAGFPAQLLMNYPTITDPNISQGTLEKVCIMISCKSDL
jgi:hypothetical protein